MDLGLNGKRPLVPGSTRGIGHGIATALASAGATVAVCGRDASVGRYGTVQEFAAVAAFVASERASYVTGSMIRVDGGMIRGLG